MDGINTLLNIIDDRAKKTQGTSSVVRTSMIVTEIISSTKVKAKISGYDSQYTLLNKTGLILKVGDNVVVESTINNLNNGVVVYLFGDKHINFEEAINSVVESGSNTNGNWIKYDDGTMICWLKIVVTNQTIDSSYKPLGADFTIYIGSRTWTFPVAFVSSPVVTCSRFQWGSGGSWGVSLSDPTTTTGQLRGYDSVSRATGTNCYIEATAIGKWK
jgi:hypothetical protein